MNFLKKLLYILIIISAISSCRDIKSSKINIVGAWQLVRIQTNDGGVIFPHNGIKAIFNPDSTLTFDRLPDTVTWSLVLDSLIINNSPIKHEIFSNGSYHVVNNNGKLIIQGFQKDSYIFTSDQGTR